MRYVDTYNANPRSPYITWATAATNIQDAVDAAAPGDPVLVTNGVYRFGGRLVSSVTNVLEFPWGNQGVASGPATNRVAITKAVIVQSVNGPQATFIEGQRDSYSNYVRCAFLTNGATLDGFTLTKGLAQVGGAVWCLSTNALVSNCIIVSNMAVGGAGGAFSGTVNHCLILNNRGSALFAGIPGGGGAFSSVLNNCVLTGNIAAGGGGASGGGACFCTLNSCTVVSNTASAGGAGVDDCTVNNSIVYHNIGFGFQADNYSPGGFSYSFNYSCTTPMPTNGLGNITNEPAFISLENGDLHLQTNSPCINAGKNEYVTGSTDLDGNPRIAGGTVDIGAYEFQSPASAISYAWLMQHGLPIDNVVDQTDSDSDGMNNWQEWRADTDPTNALSVLWLSVPSNDASGIVVQWQSVNTRTYFLERATDLAAQPPFSNLASNIAGQSGTTSYMDTNAVGSGPFFYRVGVR